jgi:hypothetical protein
MEFLARNAGKRSRLCRKGLITVGILALLFLTAVAPGDGKALSQRSSSPYPQLPEDANPLPSVSDQQRMREQQKEKQNFDLINSERIRQIESDSTRLLKMAIDLKAEVDKTSKDTLSLSVIRKADAIEKLAHDVKEKMKLSIGSN